MAGKVNTYTLAATGKDTDRPTITHNPLLGDKFSKSLMTPITLAALLSLIQAGWSAEALLRCCVHPVDGRQNFEQRVHCGRAAAPSSSSCLRYSGACSAQGVGMRLVRDNESHTTTLFFRPRKSGPAPEHVAAAGRLPGIDISAPEYRVFHGSGPKDEHEIAIPTCSMPEILLDMSSCIDVPAAHIADKRAAPGFAEAGAATAGLPPLIRVHGGTEQPADAFLTIRCRKHGFWIEGRDLNSKGILSFLMCAPSMGANLWGGSLLWEYRLGLIMSKTNHEPKARARPRGLVWRKPE